MSNIDFGSPPWVKTDIWREANQTMTTLVERYGGRLQSAETLASSVHRELKSSFGILGHGPRFSDNRC